MMDKRKRYIQYIILNCDYCRKKIEIRPKAFKELEHHFCNRKCYWNWCRKENHPNFIKRIIVSCDYCGKKIKITPNNKSKYHFCNRNCRTKWQRSEKNPYKGKNSPYCKPCITVSCDYCGKKIEIRPSNKSKRHFCNQLCYWNWKGSNQNPMKGIQDSRYIKRITVSCDYCRKKIEIIPRNVMKSAHHFCSSKCSSNWHKKENNPNFIQRIILNCDYCGKEIEIMPGNRSKHHFCNRKCYGFWKSLYMKKLFKNKKIRDAYFKKISIQYIITFCDYCNKEIKVHPKAFKELEHHFCNQLCYGLWMSLYMKKLFKNKEIKEIFINTMASGQKHPSNLELTLLSVIEEYNLPFKFTGFGKRGERVAGLKPDFTDTLELKKLIEVYSIVDKNNRYRGGINRYRRDRFFHFGRCGYDVLFITLENDILRKDCKKHCVQLIKIFEKGLNNTRIEWFVKLIFNYNHLWYCLIDLVNYMKNIVDKEMEIL